MHRFFSFFFALLLYHRSWIRVPCCGVSWTKLIADAGGVPEERSDEPRRDNYCPPNQPAMPLCFVRLYMHFFVKHGYHINTQQQVWDWSFKKYHASARRISTVLTSSAGGVPEERSDEQRRENYYPLNQTTMHLCFVELYMICFGKHG